MMNKELTPLEAFDKALDIICKQRADNNLQSYIDIVESALKNGEWYKRKMIMFEIAFTEENAEKLKLKKALEIIKDWFEVFEDENGYHLRPLFDIGRIDKETFDLLKEILK